MIKENKKLINTFQTDNQPENKEVSQAKSLIVTEKQPNKRLIENLPITENLNLLTNDGLLNKVSSEDEAILQRIPFENKSFAGKAISCFNLIEEKTNKPKEFIDFDTQLFKGGDDGLIKDKSIPLTSFSDIKPESSLADSVFSEQKISKTSKTSPKNITLLKSLDLNETKSDISNIDIDDPLTLTVNDLVEVFCDSDGKTHKGKILQIQAKAIASPKRKSSEEENSNNDKDRNLLYYIHFIDYEKRMDNWYPFNSILRKLKTSKAKVSIKID